MNKIIYFVILVIIFNLFVFNAQASNKFDNMEAYRRIKELMNIEGKTEGTSVLVDELLQKLKVDDPLYEELVAMKADLLGGNKDFQQEKAIKFGTGTKNEIYYRNKGLVYLKFIHNDGTISELKLTISNRDMGGSYSLIKKGDWIYELTTGYRNPTLFTSWIEEADSNSYTLKERSKNSEDNGMWKGIWHDEHRDISSACFGAIKEPLPMYMASFYHLWGEKDLGFCLKFKAGYKDKQDDKINIAKDKILFVTAERKVLSKLERFSYKDATGKEYFYSDCYNVVVLIKRK